MASYIPLYENHIAVLKVAIIISVLAHCVLLGMPRDMLQHSLPVVKEEGIALDLDYTVSPDTPEKTVHKKSLPEQLAHVSEESNVVQKNAVPVKKKEIAHLSFKKSKQENLKQKKSQSPKQVNKTETPNQPQHNTHHIGAHSNAVYAPVKESVNPRPVYPELARKRGHEGIVRVRCRVDDKGNVTAISVAQSSGHKLLDEATLKTVRKWRFKPALSNGRPVEGSVIVPVEFRLR